MHKFDLIIYGLAIAVTVAAYFRDPGLPAVGLRAGFQLLLDVLPRLAAVLEEYRPQAFLFRDLATLRTNVPVFTSVDALRWTGPTPRFEATCDWLGSPGLARRAAALAITPPRLGSRRRSCRRIRTNSTSLPSPSFSWR